MNQGSGPPSLGETDGTRHSGSGERRPFATPTDGSSGATVAAATQQAYAADWAHFTRWCRMNGADPLPATPALVGLYLASLAPALSVASIERRLAGLGWGYRQRGQHFDRQDHQVAAVLAEIRRDHARPPVQKAVIRPDDIRAMVATLPHDLRGLRDRAILLCGFAGGLRRSEITGLDRHKDDTPDSRGWIDLRNDDLQITLRGRAGWRSITIPRGPTHLPCPVMALDQWLHFAKIDFGPIFTAVTRDGKRAVARRMNDKHVARLVKSCAQNAGLRPDLSDAARDALYAGDSLRRT